MVGAEEENAALLRRHLELETVHDDGQQGDFLSGWQCINPWAEVLAKRVLEEAAVLSTDRYIYPEHDEMLVEQVRAYHEAVDGHLPPKPIFGAGSSPILASLAAWLSSAGYKEVFCIQPLYYSLLWNLKLHEVRARPVSGRHPYEAGFTMNLPEQRTVLLMADPTWYAGTSVPQEVVAAVSAWQQRTGSLVFVDGSFQYMKWSPTTELTSVLDPSLTGRLICPTKALALHGHRFSYALFPNNLAKDIAYVLSMLEGSSSATLIACGRVAMEEMRLGTVTRAITRLISQRHADLRVRGVLSAPWQPNSGYFVFERIQPTPTVKLMDGGFFGQHRFPGFFRVNLLSPSIASIG